ncbi:beta-1,4-N-acetylgalactosaminyltransferase 2 [Sarotherodon galilaeus]
MELITRTLLLGLALSFTNAAPVHQDEPAPEDGDAALPDRCEGIEFDAITLDESGKNPFFFKDGHLWNGFYGPAKPSTMFFKELDEHHHLGHVDAAFRMHNPENQDAHDHIFLFLDDHVFSYYNHTLETGYPKTIQEDFLGVPTHLDAAVECPQGECITDSVLFFKGQDVYVYDIVTKTVKTKTWPHLPLCTSAFRWAEHYYCFHGHNFTRFNPVSGEVSGTYPKDARNYFMKCENFGHGGDHKAPKCSEVKLDAITTDDRGRIYLFTGLNYMGVDNRHNGLHAFPITRGWKEVTNGVDAVFSYTNKMYLIKDDQVYIYKTDAHYVLIEGYPKSLREELGIEGTVDAAFLCPNEHTVHILQGHRIRDVDLSATPRVINREIPLPLPDIDAGLCGPDGIKVFKGSQYYLYESPMVLATSKIAPVPQNITSGMMGCED